MSNQSEQAQQDIEGQHYILKKENERRSLYEIK